MNGVIVVDKPAGLTSADVVARAKRALGARRIGHTGTLDPMATGVLPLVAGEATKLAPFLLTDDKEYEGELVLGLRTTTLDVEGEVVERGDPAGVDEPALCAALAAWVGVRAQVPPMYSALKHDGRRLYELARAGVEVERAAREITIDRFELTAFEGPRARFVVSCSKGTYVRALVRDIGDALGCGATLSALRRTRAGRFVIADAVPLDRLHSRLAPLPLADVLAHLPAVSLDAAQLGEVAHGRPLHAPGSTPSGPIRLLTPDGALAALAEAKEGRLAYLRVFNYGLSGG